MVLKEEINLFFLFTCFSMIMAYSVYHTTFMTIGPSLFVFGVLQIIFFSYLALRHHKIKLKSMQELYRIINHFQVEDKNDIRIEQQDEDFYLLSKRLLECKQKFLEDRYIYKHAQIRFLHILQNISSPVLLLDNEGKIQFLNSAGEQLFQVSRLDVISKTHWKIGRVTGISVWIEKVRKSGKPIQTILSFPEPSQKVFEVTISPTKSPDDQIQEIIIVMHDMTEREKLEKLRKEFVANVTHELRTPLTSIKGFTETLLDGALEQREVAEKFLNIIYRESDRLQEMVESLLDLTIIENKPLETSLINLTHILEEAVEEMRIVALEKNISITLENPYGNIFLSAEKYRIKQVLINLLSNSIKYSLPDKHIKVQTKMNSGEVQFIVTDQGFGIPQEHIDRIFERFYRVDSSRNQKSGGRGIGLSIVKQIIKQHGGHIFIHSKENVGTTITVSFPKKADQLTS